MVFSGQKSAPIQTRILPAILTLLVCTLLSFLSVNIGARGISLSWLPLLVLALWPRQSSAVVTILCCLAFGLILDWGSGGAPGQWALALLAVFAVLRPDRRAKGLSLVGAIQSWVVAVIVAGAVVTLTGRFVYSVWPDFLTMGRQLGLVTCLLPVLFYLRRGVRYLLTDADERDY